MTNDILSYGDLRGEEALTAFVSERGLDAFLAEFLYPYVRRLYLHLSEELGRAIQLCYPDGAPDGLAYLAVLDLSERCRRYESLIQALED